MEMDDRDPSGAVIALANACKFGRSVSTACVSPTGNCRQSGDKSKRLLFALAKGSLA